MIFVDKAKIHIKAGDGGNGCTSFYTEKYVPNGGPDGGDGGDGGSIIFTTKGSKANLSDFRYEMKLRAEDGAKGSPKMCHGKKGKDLIISVPRGTVIRDFDSGSIIADMFAEDATITVLKGGFGGKGNARFRTSRRQAPHFSQMGEKTDEKTVMLELKTIADVGLIGYPNVGKSTLLSVISGARPKIADYHFTTLSPNLGVVSVHDSSFVMADIPGLIEGAAQGIGLGHEFLRHVERTRLLVHVIDISGREGRNPYDDYKNINNELKLYNKALAKLPQIIALNKCDLLTEGDSAVREFKKHIRGKKVITISGATSQGIKELKEAVMDLLVTLPPPAPIDFEPFVYAEKDKESLNVSKLAENVYEVSGGLIEEITRGVVLDDYDSFNYFQKQLKERGINKAMKKAGVKDGDTVRIMDFEFEYQE